MACSSHQLLQNREMMNTTALSSICFKNNSVTGECGGKFSESQLRYHKIMIDALPLINACCLINASPKMLGR